MLFPHVAKLQMLKEDVDSYDDECVSQFNTKVGCPAQLRFWPAVTAGQQAIML